MLIHNGNVIISNNDPTDEFIHLGHILLINLVLITAIAIILLLLGIFIKFTFLTILPYAITMFYMSPILITIIGKISKKTKMEWYDDKEDNEQFEKFED